MYNISYYGVKHKLDDDDFDFSLPSPKAGSKLVTRSTEGQNT